MGTFNDAFTGGYDTGFWTYYESVAGANITEASNEIQLDYTVGSSWQESGLKSQIVYDMGAADPAHILCTPTKLSAGSSLAFIMYACLTDVSNPDAESNWYRMAVEDAFYYAQKKVSGSKTTLGSGAISDPTGLEVKIDFPTTGDDVQFFIDGANPGGGGLISDATYALSSRDCYIYMNALYGTSGGLQEVDFDTFEMVSVDYAGAPPAGAGKSNPLYGPLGGPLFGPIG